MSVHHRDRQPWYRWLKWGDFLIYGLVTLTAVLLLIQLPARSLAAAERQARLYVDGTLVRTFTAGELQTGGEYVFSANSLHYRLEYAHNDICIRQADCPDQVCVQTGWLSHDGQLSACVPGHVILKIEGQVETGNGTSGDVDVIIG